MTHDREGKSLTSDERVRVRTRSEPIISGNKPYLNDAVQRRLRVAIVAPPWFELPPPGYGGIEWICYWLAEGLVQRGHDVTVIGAGPRSMLAHFVATFEEPPTARLGEPLLELIHVARAAEILRSGHFDIVHDHTLSGPLLSFGLSASTVVTAHGPIYPDNAEYYRALRNHISLVSISHSQREQTPSLPWAGTVHNAIPVREYSFRDQKEEFVLWMGRMSPDKGAHLAIEAAREAGYPIVLAGKCNEAPEHAYFEEEVKPRLGPDVLWIGEAGTRTKMDLLARARCFLFPIQWEEPFGLVMVEAMAAGTPVVTMRRGSVPELVVDGQTGFICDHISDLGDAIHAAADIDPAACRLHALSRFDLPIMVRGYERIYESVLARPMVAQSQSGRMTSLAASAQLGDSGGGVSKLAGSAKKGGSPVVSSGRAE